MEIRANPFFKVKVKNDSYDFEFPTISIEEDDFSKLKNDLDNEINNLNKELTGNKKTKDLSVESELVIQKQTGDGGPGTEIINFLNSDTIIALCNLITLSPFIVGLLAAITRNLRFRIEEILNQDYDSINLPIKSMFFEALDNLKNNKHKTVTDLIFSSNRFNEDRDCFFIFRIKETENKDLFFLYEFRDNEMQEPYVFY